MSNEHQNVGSGLDSNKSSESGPQRGEGFLAELKDVVALQNRAVMLAGGLAIGAMAVPASQGCSFDFVNQGEHTGTNSVALATEWSEGTVEQYNVSPDTHWESGNPNNGYRIFSAYTTPILYDGAIYISSTTDNGANWTASSLLQTSAGPLLNDPASNEFGAMVCFGGGCGTGKLISATDRDGMGDDLWWWDFDELTKTVSNGAKMPNLNVDWDSENGVAVNSTGNVILFSRQDFGTDWNIYQADFPGLTNIQPVTGLNTALNEAAPFFFGDDNIVAFDSSDPDPWGSMKKANYNYATHSVSGITKINELDIGSMYEGTGRTDSKGETCFGVDMDPGDGGPIYIAINCDPDVPGPSTPDGGTGGTGGTAGTGGSGGTETGGSGGTGATGGTGGIGGVGGSGGSAPVECAPGCAPTMVGDGNCDTACNVIACNEDNGDCAGTGGTGGGTGGTGGAAGEGGTGATGGTGGSPEGGTGATGGTGGSPEGGTGGAAGQGGSPEGGTGGTAGAGGETPDCPITVTINSGDCEVVDCENLAIGGAVGLNAYDADCTFSFEDYATFTAYGTGNSTFRGSDLYPAESLDNAVIYEDPNHTPKMRRIYPISTEGNYVGGLLGTEINGNIETRDGKMGYRTEVTQDSMAHMVCKNDRCVTVSTVGPDGVQIADTEVFLPKEDLVVLLENIDQPDAGPIVTPPPAESGDDSGCSISRMSPHDVNAYIYAVLVAAGLIARRRKED